ncbi:putative gustatory receptor 28b [Schistocerca cancellata]|uniref:putative gustatory receptor 28b n=1 Tax=Schistocerca cancellata TaxID=274614 RepID=UPI002118A942|nr:putative gustatory receptor 28b [Schistocerca cancellata]
MHLRLISGFFTCSLNKLKYYKGFLDALDHIDELLAPSITNEVIKFGYMTVISDVFMAVILILSSFLTLGKSFGQLTIVQVFINSWVIISDLFLKQQFLLSVLELWTRFRTLKAVLVESLSPLGDPRLSQLLLGWRQKLPHVELSGRLRRLQQAHLLLQRAAELLQAHVSPTLTFHVMYSMLGCIYSSYELLVVLVVPQAVDSVLAVTSVSFTICWLLRHVFNVATMAIACSALEEEAVKMAELLRRAAGITETSPEVKDFLRQVERGLRPAFSASGLLHIDRKLLVTTVSATTTYLIVLGQIGLQSTFG